MPRKRMILEEVPELNPLVPGSPDNPLKLGEKAKNVLVRMKIYEDDGRTGDPTGNNYSEDYRYAMERLEFLKLIEYRPKYDGPAVALIQSRIEALRTRLGMGAATMSRREIADLVTEMEYAYNRLDNNTNVAWLTDAGRQLLLSGAVTVSL